MIRVLIVEDSITIGTYLELIFNQEKDMEVIGRVSNGKKAISFCQRDKPDVITMDIEMPIMNGLEATRIIMSTQPVPIVIITASRNSRETRMTMQALEAGALTLIEKPRGLGTTEGCAQAAEMINLTRLMSGVKVVTWRDNGAIKTPTNLPTVSAAKSITRKKDIEMVGIGVSTGGPAVLKEILSEIISDFPLPIVIVQHIAPGFLGGMINWLSASIKIKLKIAEEGESLLPGIVYFAPDNYHLNITDSEKIKLVDKGNENICPSVAHLFDSMYRVYKNKCLAILLTGMGKDGAKEMKILHDAGAMTIAQSPDSALVNGMPGEAVKLNAARYLLKPLEIAGLLNNLGNSDIFLGKTC